MKLNDPDGKIQYELAGKWFLHLSNLRRTTLAFVFIATGASIGILSEKLFEYSKPSQVIPIAIFNVLIVFAGILQEIRLHAYHKKIADYLQTAEDGSGPFSDKTQTLRSFGTHVVILGIFYLLGIAWLISFVLQICKSS